MTIFFRVPRLSRGPPNGTNSRPPTKIYILAFFQHPFRSCTLAVVICVPLMRVACLSRFSSNSYDTARADHSVSGVFAGCFGSLFADTLLRFSIYWNLLYSHGWSLHRLLINLTSGTLPPSALALCFSASVCTLLPSTCHGQFRPIFRLRLPFMLLFNELAIMSACDRPQFSIAPASKSAA